MFKLDARLNKDTLLFGRLELSLLLLMNDRSLPWLILVPEREGICDIDELPVQDRALLIEEVSLLSGLIRKLFRPDKINVGALGNVVPQFHVHVLGRFINDRAWPGPIWGTGPVIPYGDVESAQLIERIRNGLAGRIK
jgi:diadenosine tetraphosphate (Ap4A) HIT family hydrolase